jgi:hypothetical protein
LDSGGPTGAPPKIIVRLAGPAGGPVGLGASPPKIIVLLPPPDGPVALGRDGAGAGAGGLVASADPSFLATKTFPQRVHCTEVPDAGTSASSRV